MRQKVKMYVFRIEKRAIKFLREKHAFQERTRRNMNYRLTKILIAEELREGDWLKVRADGGVGLPTLVTASVTVYFILLFVFVCTLR